MNEIIFEKQLNLQLFGAGDLVNTTEGYRNANNGATEAFAGIFDLSPNMKEYWNTDMLENARAELYFEQFADKAALPAHNGKTLERRRWNTLAPAMKPLVEGVTPTGKRMGETRISTSIRQYGDFVEYSDVIDLHSVDPILVGASEELGAQAGQTKDLLNRNVLLTCTNVLFAPNLAADGTEESQPVTRWQLGRNAKLTPDVVAQAAVKLEKDHAPKIDGYYTCVIHPSVAYDIRTSDDFNEFHKYAAVTELFNGELGELHGVRFVKTTNAAVYSAAPLLDEDQRYLSVTAYSALDSEGTATAGDGTMYQVTVAEDITNAAEKLVGRYVQLEADGAIVELCKIVGVNAASKYLFLDTEPTNTPASGDYLNPGEGGMELKADGKQNAAYACIFLGAKAYASIDVEGAGLEMLVHSKKIAGGPLEQRATVGWKFSHAALIQYPERILRVEVTSPKYSATDRDVLDDVA